VVGSLRQRVAHLDDDRVLAGDLEEAVEWLRRSEWRAALSGVAAQLR
jgi:histidine ammonia-lyase